MTDRLPPGVREAVYLRDGNSCVICSRRATNIHHRRPGQKRVDADHRPWNLLSLCGSGTTGCHGWIESNREKARSLGLLVPQNRDPETECVVFTRWGWQQLYDGGYVWGRPDQDPGAVPDRNLRNELVDLIFRRDPGGM